MASNTLGMNKISHGKVAILSKFKGNYIKIEILIEVKIFPFDT